jgi:hypothetical protein
MPNTDGERMISTRLDPATARDLARLERHFRAGTSVVVRMAIAEMARRLGLSDEDTGADQGKAAA